MGRRLCWLLLNLFLALGCVPSAWMREVSFIRKRGPRVVTDLKNLRPISYTDDLQTLFDMGCRKLLEEYVGKEQAGGRLDCCLIFIGVLVALQTRRNFPLPTFLSKGRFASGLRPGMETCSPPLYPVGWNLRRFLAICLNSALCQDQFRVKYGPLVSPTLLFCSRAGPRWAASRAPFWCSSTGNSGIAETNYRSGPWLLSPPFWDALQLNQRLSGDVCWLEIVRLVSRFRELGVSLCVCLLQQLLCPVVLNLLFWQLMLLLSTTFWCPSLWVIFLFLNLPCGVSGVLAGLLGAPLCNR